MLQASILIINTTLEWDPNPSAINSLVEINLASLSLWITFPIQTMFQTCRDRKILLNSTICYAYTRF